MENKIRTLLCDLGVCDEQSIVPFYPRTRDREDVSVLKCTKSGVIFLSRSDHMEMSHYRGKQDLGYGGVHDREKALEAEQEDTERRARQFGYLVAGRRWLDVGTGNGGILDALAPVASRASAVEPQDSARQSLVRLGYNVWPSVGDVPGQDVEIATLFHVLEHFTDPVGTLSQLRRKMDGDAKIVVEVPHARDFLISFLELDAFKAFTFWSEHLILHTRDSLKAFLEKAGFSDVVVTGVQRYPLANHLHWLARGKPGGHVEWKQLRTPELDAAYAAMLDRLDGTDTLIAVASNPKGTV